MRYEVFADDFDVYINGVKEDNGGLHSVLLDTGSRKAYIRKLYEHNLGEIKLVRREENELVSKEDKEPVYQEEDAGL